MQKTLVVLSLALLAWLARCPATEQETAQWLVVTAPALRAPLAPLIEHRRAEGLKVVVIESTNVLTPEQIQQTNALPLRAHLSRLCQAHQGPSCVLLVGAATASDPGTAEQTVVPALTGTIGVMRGQPSDHAFGRPDTNSAATVAVGRFPARNAEEVRGMVEKTLRFERDRLPGAWRSRLTLLGGNPGGGPLAETIYESLAGPRYRQVHATWSVHALFHSDSSIYYLPGTRIHDTALHLLEEGQIFSFYLGHSNPSVMVSSRTPLMTRNDWAGLKIERGQGVFFTTGCSSCRWADSGGEGYGVAAMRNAGGPVAVMGAHLDSYSALGLLALDGMVRCLATPPFPARLADYWLAVQAGLARGEIDNATFTLLDMADGSQGKTPLAVQRQEHLEMWMLLGDPALRLPLVPLDVRLNAAGPVSPGQPLAVTGALPERLAGAKVLVTVERPIGAKPANLEKLPARGTENREAIAVENHRRANDVVLAHGETKANGIRFECRVPVPTPLPWSNLVLRAEATSATDAACGVLTVLVRDGSGH